MRESATNGLKFSSVRADLRHILSAERGHELVQEGMMRADLDVKKRSVTGV